MQSLVNVGENPLSIHFWKTLKKSTGTRVGMAKGSVQPISLEQSPHQSHVLPTFHRELEEPLESLKSLTSLESLENGRIPLSDSRQIPRTKKLIFVLFYLA